MDKILLIDYMNLLWRSSIRFGPKVLEHKLSNKSTLDNFICECNSPFNVEEDYCYGNRYYIVYNFFKNIKPILERFKPNYTFLALEGNPKHRKHLDSNYKGNRVKVGSKTPIKSIIDVHDLILDLCLKLPFTAVKSNDYEGDDVIATLCENLKTEDLIIVSTDNDYIQLLQKEYKNIQIFNPIKKEFMCAPTYSYVCWKALAGDKSDNIKKLLPNKKSIKTCTNPDLLLEFLNLEENRANFNINKQLIELINIPENELIFIQDKLDIDFVKKEFEKMKFNSLLNDKYWNVFNLNEQEIPFL